MSKAALKIDDSVWRKIVKQVKGATAPIVKVGIIGDATNASVATIHEYGAPSANIPERSFLRATLTADLDKIGQIQAKAAAAVIAGKLDGRKALGLIGAYVAGAMKSYVVNATSFAPLSPITIAAKKSSKPLIDTGQMVGAITWVIEG